MLVMLVLALPAAAALGQDEGEPPPGAMLVILDASGSMNTVDTDGVPFIDKAKEAVLQLIDALPDGMQVGLRVYGHREPNTDPVAGCRDTELIAPVAPLDREEIREAVEGLEASGFTPIGLSLTEAAADLPETGPRSIVLVSDGEDTCAPPDPCRIAEELYGEAFDVRIESVGFLVGTGSAAEQQLRCIAEASGGGYSTVDDANALAARLEEVSEEILAWRPPTTLSGALNRFEAPELPLEPKADWVDDEPGKIAVGRFASIIMPGETRWYQVDLWRGEWMWVWADLGWPPGADAGGEFEVIALDSAGNPVGVGVGHGGIPLRTQLPGSDSPMVGITVPDWERPGIPETDTYFFGLHWDAPSEVFLGSVEFTVEVLGGDVDRYLDRTEIEGSVDPGDAPTLELAPNPEYGHEGREGRFRAPLASGETRWYRLEVGRGGVMDVVATFPGDRFVGDDRSGEFAIHLTDGDGNPIGTVPDYVSQMAQAFGDERHQATVGATSSGEDDPVPETVLVGFEWDGPAGQQSEIRFEVGAGVDPIRVEAADRIETEANRPDDEEESTTWSTTTTSVPSTTVGAAAEDGAGEDDGEGGGMPFVLYVVIGIAALTGGVIAPMAARRRTSEE